MEKKISRLPFKMINVIFSVALDLILHGPPRTVHRRHSVSVCQTPPPPAADRSSAAAAARRKAMHQNKQFSLGMREKKTTERVRKNATQTQRAKQRISVDDDIPSPESVISRASSMVSFTCYIIKFQADRAKIIWQRVPMSRYTLSVFAFQMIF